VFWQAESDADYIGKKSRPECRESERTIGILLVRAFWIGIEKNCGVVGRYLFGLAKSGLGCSFLIETLLSKPCPVVHMAAKKR
jgi:hypothetical protein